MYVEGGGSFFGLKFILLLFALWLIIFLFDEVMRRLLKVERRKLFSYNHVNSRHKKIDWGFRIAAIIWIVVGGFVNIARYPSTILFLEPYFILLVMIFLTESVRIRMEWKYAENRNAYLLTLLQLIFIAIVLSVLYMTNIFGLFGQLW